MRTLVWLADPAATDPALVGPKAARLATAVQAGFPVPPAFVITTGTFSGGKSPALAAEIEAAASLLWDSESGNESRHSALAVRSSAIAEDLTGASFAGLQRTILGVTDRDALARAVEEVWASLESAEARAYRARMASTASSAMAVIVQRQVEARVAGVAFARDPIRGDDAIVIEAVAGLGEALVSGKVDPLSWRLIGGRIVDRPVGAGEEPLLPDDVLRDIGVLVERASQLFGSPQDVEWAWDGQKLWLLQARPITGRLEDFFTDDLPGDHFLWTAAFLNERFTEPVSPLGWTLVAEPLAWLAFGAPLALLGASQLDDEGEGARESPVLKLWHGHPYSRVAAWQRLYKLFPDALLPEDAVRYFPLGDVSLRRAPRLPRWGLHLVRNALSALRRDGRAVFPWGNPQAWREYEVEHVARLSRMRVEVAALDALPPASRERLIRRLLAESQALAVDLLAIHRWSLLWAELLFSFLRRLLQALAGPEMGARLAAHFTTGASSHTGRLNQAVAALAERARARSAVRSALARAGDVEALAEILGPADPFVRALRAFLAAYGHRFFSLDLYDPPYEADPRPLFDLIVTMAASPAGAGLNGGDDERPGDEGRTALPLLRSALLRLVRASPLVRLTRRLLRLREDQRFRWQEILAIQRRLVLSLGALWAADGALVAPEHVFGLTWQELLAAAPDPALGERAAHRFLRLQTLRRQAAQAPGWHYPEFLRGNRPLRHFQDGATLRGRPVSPGIARGRARLVASPADFARLTPGDILVTTSPDPGWTPVFETIAALVTERGGQLSHGAVVAREYGLPAVSGIADAMRLIEEGEELLVDGTQGLVLRLEAR